MARPRAQKTGRCGSRICWGWNLLFIDALDLEEKSVESHQIRKGLRPLFFPQSAQISAEGPEAAHVLPFAIAAQGHSSPVLLRSDVNARSVEVDPLELRGKRHLELRCNADLTAPLSTSGRGAWGLLLCNVDSLGRGGREGALVAFSQTGSRGRHTCHH